MAKKKEIDYKETFMFPDIIGQPFPVYCLSFSGKLCNFKNIIYPSPSSCKRFTRNKQLRKRSMQAKIFDSIINIGYWEPLIIFREFPIVIQNSLRLDGQKRMYYMMDYYFPELRLAVELDSDYHDDQVNDTDEIRDKYLMNAYGIRVFRMRNFEKPQVQKTKFHELTSLIRSLEKPTINYQPLLFNRDLLSYLNNKK